MTKRDIISAVVLSLCVCVCVCIKSSCTQFKYERSAHNPTTKQGVRVCGGSAW